jgi:hypothetical protein
MGWKLVLLAELFFQSDLEIEGEAAKQLVA